MIHCSYLATCPEENFTDLVVPFDHLGLNMRRRILSEVTLESLDVTINISKDVVQLFMGKRR